MKPDDITDDQLDRVENAVGMGHNAWDCVDPKEIIAAAVAVMAPAYAVENERLREERDRLHAFVTEYIEAFEDGLAGDSYLLRHARAALAQ